MCAVERIAAEAACSPDDAVDWMLDRADLDWQQPGDLALPLNEGGVRFDHDAWMILLGNGAGLVALDEVRERRRCQEGTS